MKLHVQLNFVFTCFSIIQWHSQHEYGKEGRKAVSAWPVNEHSDASLDRHGVSNRRSSDYFSNIVLRQTTKHTKHRITDPFLEYSIGGDVRTKDQRWGNRFYFMTSSCHISCLMGGQNTETQMLSFWWNFHHWLPWKLSFWQLSVQPVVKISSKRRHFRFSEVGVIIVKYYECIYEVLQYDKMHW